MVKATAATTNVDIARRDTALAMTDAPAWRPAPGEILTATLVQVRKGGQNSEFGVYPTLVFAPVEGFPFPGDENGAYDFVALHAFHSVLKDRLADIRPSLGTVLTVKYSGRMLFGTWTDTVDGGRVYAEQPKGGKNDYESYTVIVGDGTDIELETFDWDNDIAARD